MALAISGSVGQLSTIAAGRAAKKRCRRKSAAYSQLGIEFSGHATVAAVGIQLGWDAALCTRLGVQGRAAGLRRGIGRGAVPMFASPV